MIRPGRQFAIQNWFPGYGRVVRVPAAGHLGVIEEICTAPFEESHWMPGIATLGGLPCEYCGAAV